MNLNYINRFEIKYIIPVLQLNRILEEIKTFCCLDKYSDKRGIGYKVSSLYYDSESLQFYNEKINGERNRTKLRVRRYEQISGDLCSLELKIKKNNNVEKKRIFLPYAIIKGILENQIVLESHSLAHLAADEQAVAEEVLYFKNRFQLRPKVVVKYTRLAYEGVYDSRLRVTFDTDLCVQNVDLNPFSRLRGSSPLDPKYCIMEVKFNQTAPQWLIRVLQNHNCDALRISKYCRGIERVAPKTRPLNLSTNPQRYINMISGK